MPGRSADLAENMQYLTRRQRAAYCKLSSLCDKLTGLSVMRGTQEGQSDLKVSIVCVKFQGWGSGGLQNPR